ncbi:MAG: FadR/GntR family transcriptional regulator [Rhizobiaceae bacterium]|jgi:GntR family transcriptional repressor for pyruvate dehydrogenase complex
MKPTTRRTAAEGFEARSPNIKGLLEPIRQRTATEAVAQQLIHLISSGAMSAGDKLPAERDLAEQLHVGRTTVREALKLLTLSGVLETRRGDGTYVRQKYWSFVADQIKWPTLLRPVDIEDLMEVRAPIEVRSARLAALRATETDLDEIKRALDEIRVIRGRNLPREAECDAQFHLRLAAASHNQLLLTVMEALIAPLQTYIAQANRMTVDLSTSIAEHQAIVDAIVARDPDQAAEAMSRHLDMSRQLARLGSEGEPAASSDAFWRNTGKRSKKETGEAD